MGENVDPCVFCRIISGDIPSSVLFEDEACFAFLDIRPVNKGHALVIPKKHYEKLGDIPDKELGPLMAGVKRVAVAVMEATGAEGYNLQMNNFAPAGQVVFHAHIHIIPRFSSDGLRLWQGNEYKPGEMDVILGRIKKTLDL